MDFRYVPESYGYDNPAYAKKKSHPWSLLASEYWSENLNNTLKRYFGAEPPF